jgi:hypothetical protein
MRRSTAAVAECFAVAVIVAASALAALAAAVTPFRLG